MSLGEQLGALFASVSCGDVDVGLFGVHSFGDGSFDKYFIANAFISILFSVIAAGD